MDLDFVAGRSTRGWCRRLVVLSVAGLIAALGTAIPAPAQAHTPYVAKAWGNNDFGELGIGTSEGPQQCGTERHACSTTPLQVKGLNGVSAVSSGEAFALALLEETGAVVAWGFNGGGELGDGTTAGPETCKGLPCSRIPVAVKELSGAKAIAAGTQHSLALLSSGTVMAWGAGGLGAGTTTSSDVPVVVCAPAPEPCPGSHLSGVKAIAAGDGHSLALLEDGTVVAWGKNEHGQLGNGTTTASEVPVAVKELSGVKAIAAGGKHSLALLQTGKVMAWGWNVRGELGDGGEADSDVPVAVCAPGSTAPCAAHLEGVAAVAAGANHSLALLAKEGRVAAWGENEAGQLGDGTSTGPEKCGNFSLNACAKVPVVASNVSGATALSAGERHSLALLHSRRVMAWGLNQRGQLGVDSEGPEACPVGGCSTKPIRVCAEGASAPSCSELGPFLENATGIAGGGEFSDAVVEPPPPPTPLPELGRCKAVKKGTGEWKGVNCEHLAGGKGLYNFYPGGEKAKFEGSSVGTTTTTLATPKFKISCTVTILEGEYTGAKTATATLVLKGCINAASKKKCQSKPAGEGEIESTMPLEGELGFIKGGEKPAVGLDLKKSSKAPNLATFFCANGPEPPEVQGNIEGSVIGQLLPLGHMAPEFKLTYKGAKGTQTPERFEAGVKDTLSFVFPPKGLEPPVTEDASLSATLLISNEEPLEIKPITYPK